MCRLLARELEGLCQLVACIPNIWPPAGRHDTQNVPPYVKWIADDYEAHFNKGFSLAIVIARFTVPRGTAKASGRCFDQANSI